MHGKCQIQLDACDAGSSLHHCELTTCFVPCGCGHTTTGNSLACHDACMKKSNAPSDKALMACVVSNTAWLNTAVATQKIASQKAAAAHLAAEKAAHDKPAAEKLAGEKVAGKMASAGKAAHDKGCNG